MGGAAFVQEFVREAVQGKAPAGGRGMNQADGGAVGFVRTLRKLGRATQERGLLARHCGAAKVGHLARLAPANVFSEAVKPFELAMAAEVRAMAGIEADTMPVEHERAERQAVLPLRMGGLGMRTVNGDMAAIAGMCSAAAALDGIGNKDQWGGQLGGEWFQEATPRL